MRYPKQLYSKSEEGELLEPSLAVMEMWHWVERFQNEYARQNRSPTTIIEYGYDLAGLIAYLQKNAMTSFTAVTSRTLRDYLDWLRLNNGLATVTLNRRLATLRSFFRFLREEEVIEHNPALDVRKARERRKESHTYMLADEARQLLGLIGDQDDSTYPFCKRDLAMISLMLFCGLRVSEVASLNVGDIRFRERVLVVRGKGNKVRELPLEDHILDTLHQHLDSRLIPKASKREAADTTLTPSERAKKQLAAAETSQEALFLSSFRSRISTRGIRSVLARYMKDVDLDSSKNISPHKLRHTFATLLYLNGVDINVLRELLGHADLSSTQIYAAVDKDRRRLAMEAHPLLGERP